MAIKDKKTGPVPKSRLLLNLMGLEVVYRHFRKMKELGIAKERFGQYLLNNYSADKRIPWPELAREESDMCALGLAKNELKTRA